MSKVKQMPNWKGGKSKGGAKKDHSCKVYQSSQEGLEDAMIDCGNGSNNAAQFVNSIARVYN